MPLSLISRDRFKTALRISDTADDTQLLRDLEYVSDLMERDAKRWFQVRTATLYFQARWGDRLLLSEDLLSLTTLKTLTLNDGGTRSYGAGTDATAQWAATDYDLYPMNAVARKEPYWEIRVNPEGDYSFPTDPLGVQIAGTWGYWQDTVSAGTLGAAIASTTTTSVTMTAGHSVEAGHTLLIGSEQLYVSAVATNTLTVERGVNGTTAATASNGAAVSRYRYPPVVEDACIRQGQLSFRGHDAPFSTIGGGEWNEQVRSVFTAGIHPFVRAQLNQVRRLEAV